MLFSFSVEEADRFTEKMSLYYRRELSYEMHYFPNKWWGATVYDQNSGRCTDKVYLSDQFYGSLGDDELWKGVLAHEWAHVLQGENCANNEQQADVWALVMLAHAHEMEAFQRYLDFARKGWQ